jgi:hypothetical protein
MRPPATVASGRQGVGGGNLDETVVGRHAPNGSGATADGHGVHLPGRSDD